MSTHNKEGPGNSHSHHDHDHGHHGHDHGHNGLVTIRVGEVTKKIRPGLYTVVQIKDMGNVPHGDALEVSEKGQLIELPDNGSYEIRCDTDFFVCPRVGSSS